MSRGFAFIIFENFDDLTKALSFKHIIDGEKIECKIAMDWKIMTELCVESIHEFDKIFVVQIKRQIPLNHARIRNYFSKFGIVEEILQLPKFLTKYNVTCIRFQEKEIRNKILNANNNIHSIDGQLLYVIDFGCKPDNILDKNIIGNLIKTLIDMPSYMQ